MVRKTILATAAAALLAAPLPALAVPSRVPAEMSGESEPLMGLVWQYLILPAIIALILGLVTGDDDAESP